MVNERHGEDCVDRLIRQTSLVRITDREGCLEMGVAQTLLGDGNQVRRDVHSNDLSATLEQWDDVFPRPTAEVEYGLAADIS